MSPPLPPHVALADEPILALDRHDHLERDLPDMRAAVPIAQMLEWLDALGDDDVGYVKLFRGLIASIGHNLSAGINREGEWHLWTGGPVDAQIRHRSRWSHFLFEDFDERPERREELLRQLYSEGRYSDNRPADPRATTLAIRDFLSCGGRILIDPQGRLTTGGGIPASYIIGTDAEAAECLRASRAYFEARRRWRSEPHIKRVVRMLGHRTATDWLLLEQRAAVEAAERVPA